MEHDCEFEGDGNEEKHPAIFEINLYEGLSGPGDGDMERGEVRGTIYSCGKHLLNLTESFRESKKWGDELRNLRTEKNYWKIGDALKEIDQFPARIEIYDANPISRLQCIQQKMREYLGDPGEIKKEWGKTVLVAKGGLESITELMLNELKNMEDISFSMHVERKDPKYK